MFNVSTHNDLKNMKFYPDAYYGNLKERFQNDIYLFDELFSEFWGLSNLDIKNYTYFIEKFELDSNSELSNVLQEIFNNIVQFKRGGVLEVFKFRDAVWGLPSNVLEPNDINNVGDLNLLEENVKIFRGMSKEELENDEFGQSWTTDYETARRFAEDTYSEKPKGIVAQTTISKIEVLHYDKNKEFEVILIKGNPKKSNVSIIS